MIRTAVQLSDTDVINFELRAKICGGLTHLHVVRQTVWLSTIVCGEDSKVLVVISFLWER